MRQRCEVREAAIAGRDAELVRKGARIDELEQVSTRLAELVVARDRQIRMLRAQLLRAKWGAEDDVPEEPAVAADEPETGGEAVPAESNGHHDAGPEVFQGMVEVEVGPLSDFAQLLGFEDAAGGIGSASEISVKRFTKGRATLSMRLAEPVDLLRELEERAPFEFRVRDQRSDRLVLDVDDDAG